VSRRLLTSLLGSVLIVTGAGLASPVVSPAQAVLEPTDSALTKSGTGEFENLEVTINQTKNLVNQIVRISWKGGPTTTPDYGNLNTNYLQIMQCWGGTEEEGPPREQCQYGTQKAATGGQNTASRQMTTAGVIDPLEEKYEEYLEGTIAYIPFVSWTGKTVSGRRNEFFNKNTSNESNHNRIRADGTGEEFFEVQTGVEAPGLGCGQVREGESPLCWIVVVPRGTTEVDGVERGRTFTDPLVTSPLLTSNWANRIVFPISFQPIGQSCAISGSETPLAGSDRIIEAIARWQPALCEEGGSNFSFTVLPDGQARTLLEGTKPGLVFTGYGADPEELGTPAVYAPVALSGLTIAFNVESQSSTVAAPEVRSRDGQRLDNIKLNQRLVAKLLTQSYRYDAQPKPERVADNPWDLAQDPEFLELNPQFAELKFPALGHLMTTIGQTDSARLVWDWIWADREARAWMKGEPDPWGMVINELYERASYPRSDYPRTDNACVTYTDRVVALCTFDLFPYAGDIAAAARAASRGDTLSTGSYDPVGIPPGYKRTPPQPPGKRAIVTIADTPLTDRFALTPAALRNAAGEYVLPTGTALQAAAAEATDTGVEGVVQPDPAAKIDGAYPLTSFVYAATRPALLEESQAEEYARLIDYAVGPGQVVGDRIGELPLGYSPLSADQRTQAEEAAAEIIETAGVLPEPEPTPEPEPPTEPTPEPTTDPGTEGGLPFGGGTTTPVAGGGTSSGFVDSGSSTTGGSTGDAGAESAEKSPKEPKEEPTEEPVEPTDPVVAEAATETLPTPAAPVGSIRYVAVILLIAGGLALLIAALLGRVVGRRT
jgi:hypothetical protein